MATVDSKELVRRFIDTLDSRELSQLDEICDADLIYSMNGEVISQGLDAFKQANQAADNAFPDLRRSIEELIGEGELVHVIYTMSGTFKNEYMGIPPGDELITHRASSVILVEDEKIVAQNDYFDWLTFLKDLGAVDEQVRPGGDQWPAGGAWLRPL